MPRPSPAPNRNRSSEQIRHHYETEKNLAQKLLCSTKAERARLYTQLYDELFCQVPDHPQLLKKESPDLRRWVVAKLISPLRHLLNPETVFLEIGAGDCALSIEVANYVKQVYVVEVSTEMTKNLTLPDNLKIVISDGSSIPLPPESVDVAFSNQLMEHLHPDDARDQLKHIYTALKPNSVYILITPNRLTGPHDISRQFDDVAKGFHLKEYTYSELGPLLRSVGFRKVHGFLGVKGWFMEHPLAVRKSFEYLSGLMPNGFRKAATEMRFLQKALNIKIVGYK